MATGLRVWSPTGQLICDETRRYGQVVGVLSLGDGHAGGSVTVSNSPGTTVFAASLNAQRFNMTTGAPLKPTVVTVSGNVVTWQAGDACRIIYGFY